MENTYISKYHLGSFSLTIQLHAVLHTDTKIVFPKWRSQFVASQVKV